MEIKHTSYFRNADQDKQWFLDWVLRLETLNGKGYERITVETGLGKTSVWGLNLGSSEVRKRWLFFREPEPARSFGTLITVSCP